LWKTAENLVGGDEQTRTTTRAMAPSLVLTEPRSKLVGRDGGVGGDMYSRWAGGRKTHYWDGGDGDLTKWDADREGWGMTSVADRSFCE
jgi:hypothetical protein